MDRENIIRLLEKLQDKTITKEELEVLQIYLADENLPNTLFEDVDIDVLQKQVPQSPDELFFNIQQELEDKAIVPQPKLRPWRRVASIAASLLLVCSVAWYFVMLNRPGTQEAQLVENVMPGGSKAQIRLADGSILDLESLKNDTLIQLEGYAIVKDKEGLISYRVDPSVSGEQRTVYNEIVTPKGGEYTLQLADGTQITLNAMSALRYPVEFAADMRQVELLAGEAYFEVNKVSYKEGRVPFVVKTKEETLRVLGTVFNINSYGAQPLTTLLEGSVQLEYLNTKAKLKPNQQAQNKGNIAGFHVKEVDPYYEVAWRAGRFSYDNANLKSVMSDIARWYDVEVSYSTTLPSTYFTGSISRFENIDKLLTTISLTGSVKFKREGRRVMVFN